LNKITKYRNIIILSIPSKNNAQENSRRQQVRVPFLENLLNSKNQTSKKESALAK
jgi:hypothetical protein